MITDSHSILARWRNHFCQPYSVHGVSDGKQTEIHTAEPLLPELSAYEVEMDTEKLKRHKSPSTDQIPAELIKARGRTIHAEIPKLTNYIHNNEEFPEEWKELIIVPIHKGDKRVCSRGISRLPSTYKILSNIRLSRLTPHAEEITVNFDATGQLPIIYSAFVKILEQKWEYNEAEHQLFIHFKKAYHSVRRKVLYNILIEFGIPMKLAKCV